VSGPFSIFHKKHTARRGRKKERSNQSIKGVQDTKEAMRKREKDTHISYCGVLRMDDQTTKQQDTRESNSTRRGRDVYRYIAVIKRWCFGAERGQASNLASDALV
jgi:hypothetical protein